MTSPTLKKIGDKDFSIQNATNYRFLQRNQNDDETPTAVIFFDIWPGTTCHHTKSQQSCNNVATL